LIHQLDRMNKGFSNSVLTTSQPSSRAQGSISPLKQQGEVCNEIITLATDGLTVDALLAQLMGEDGPNVNGAHPAVSSDGMICKDLILAKLQVGVSWCASTTVHLSPHSGAAAVFRRG